MSRLEECGLLLVFRERFPLMGSVSLATSVSGVTFLCVVVAGLPSFGIALLIDSRGEQSIFPIRVNSLCQRRYSISAR
jgi:hypothetical protein